MVLARINVLLQYLSRSVAARFVYDKCRARALTNDCRENYGTRTQRGRAITKRLGRGSDEAIEPLISAACARRARSDYPR
jgi:hypothetical protein